MVSGSLCTQARCALEIIGVLRGGTHLSSTFTQAVAGITEVLPADKRVNHQLLLILRQLVVELPLLRRNVLYIPDERLDAVGIGDQSHVRRDGHLADVLHADITTEAVSVLNALHAQAATDITVASESVSNAIELGFALGGAFVRAARPARAADDGGAGVILTWVAHVLRRAILRAVLTRVCAIALAVAAVRIGVAGVHCRIAMVMGLSTAIRIHAATDANSFETRVADGHGVAQGDEAEMHPTRGAIQLHGPLRALHVRRLGVASACGQAHRECSEQGASIRFHCEPLFATSIGCTNG